MKRFISVVSQAVFVVAVVAICIGSAQAQNTPESAEGVLQPPPEITNIVSIDAHNTILIESHNPDAPNEPKQYALSVPRHIYAGGIARIFGGSVVPTEVLVIPESARRAPSGVSGIGNNNGGFNGGGNFNNSNRGFSTYSPRLRINNTQQFNRVLGLLDRPLRQAQTGISQ